MSGTNGASIYPRGASGVGGAGGHAPVFVANGAGPWYARKAIGKANGEVTHHLQFGQLFLERLQESAGMPYHAPTLMFSRSERHKQLFKPENPLAKSLLAIFRCDLATEGQVDQLKACGFAVEIRP